MNGIFFQNNTRASSAYNRIWILHSILEVVYLSNLLNVFWMYLLLTNLCPFGFLTFVVGQSGAQCVARCFTNQLIGLSLSGNEILCSYSCCYETPVPHCCFIPTLQQLIRKWVTVCVGFFSNQGDELNVYINVIAVISATVSWGFWAVSVQRKIAGNDRGQADSSSSPS